MDMADNDTRDQVIEILKRACPLLSVLKSTKPCSYFGPSKSCRDCTRPWLVTAEEVLKLAKTRRASYELEKEKSLVLEVLLKDAVRKLEYTQGILGDIRTGAKALRHIWEMPDGADDKGGVDDK
jgi:hypothetical protein